MRRETTRRQGPEEAEEAKASVRAKVEHPFLVVKRHFGYAKVRYRVPSEEHEADRAPSGFHEPAGRGTNTVLNAPVRRSARLSNMTKAPKPAFPGPFS